MSQFAGEFVLVRGSTGEPSSGLVGRGTIDVGPSGIVVTTARRRGGLAKVIATVLAIAVTLVFVVVMVSCLDAFHVEVEDIRMPGVAGVVVLALTWFGAEAVLVRILPVARLQKTLVWSFVPAVRRGAARVDLVTTSPELSGLSGFVVDRPDVFAQECEAMRRAM